MQESYEDCTEEEQAKRKDTSTASLKYASEIYLAKGGATVLGGSKSPIKPATFIPPLSRNISTVDLEGNQSTSFKVRTILWFALEIKSKIFTMVAVFR